MEITIAYLYPDLLNLYGDKGNLLTLKRRGEARGIDVTVKEYQLGDIANFDKTDILYLGGGTDRNQELALQAAFKMKDSITDYAENDGVILAVCGGYEMLGANLAASGMEGLKLLDIEAKKGKKRLIGNIITQSETLGFDIVGFENHIGRMDIKNHTPLGKVIYGNGNTDKKDVEGVIYKNVIGTYIHGPILPKNPSLADYIIKKALERKYGEINLADINDDWENKAHSYIMQKYMNK